MPFYDFYSDQDCTALGRRWMRQAAVHVLTVMTRAVTPLSKVVEIGPGWGALAKECDIRGLQYAAIDTNLRVLSHLGTRLTICSLVPPIPLRTGVCDVVVASHVLEHADGLAKAQELVSEMRRIVRPSGCVVLVSPDVLWTGKYFWDCDYSHNFPTSSRRLMQMCLDHKLEIVKMQYLYNHLAGWRGNALARLLKLIPYRYVGAQPNSFGYSEKIYRLRMAFSRSILVVARAK
jgi:SAM-dependent methyltransferase